MENLNKPVNPKGIADKYNISYPYFRKMFKKYSNISPGQFHMQQKIDKSKQILMCSEKSVKEIAQELGFESLFYFSKKFKEKTGISPSQFRNNYFNVELWNLFFFASIKENG